jgi:hypothetical protein
MNLIFHIAFFTEQTVKMITLFIILIFNVHVESLNIFRFSIRSMFV